MTDDTKPVKVITRRANQSGGPLQLRRQRQAEYIKWLPEKVVSLVKRVFDKTASPRQAIKAKCIGCCGAENYANRIRECDVVICELWRYRPYQVRTNESDDDGV